MNGKYQDLFKLVKSHIGPSTMEALKFLVNEYYEQISKQESKREEVWASLREVVEENRRRAFVQKAPIGQVFSSEDLQLLSQLPRIEFDEIRANGKKIDPNRLKREEATRILEQLAVVSRLGEKIILGYPYWVEDASGNKTLFPTSLPEALVKLAAFFRTPKYRTMFCRHMAGFRKEKFVDMEGPEFTPEVIREGLEIIYQLVNDLKDKFHQQKKATDFYNEVGRFYHRSAEKVYVFSTTSGLVVKDEYLGDIKTGKNPYRRVYFEEIYNTDIEVHYQLDPETTIRCLENSKWSFKQNAEHFSKILTKPNIEITEADFSKASWKKHYTLCSPNLGINFSVRKGEKIHHGINVNIWDDPQESVFSDVQKCYMEGAQGEPIKPFGISFSADEAKQLAFEVLKRWRKQYLQKIDQLEKRLRIIIERGRGKNREQLFPYVKKRFLEQLREEPSLFLDLFEKFLKLAPKLRFMEETEDEWATYSSWLKNEGLEHSFGNFLKYLRESKGFSYREASEKAGVKHSHLYHLETNDKSPSRDTAIKITEGLDGNRTVGQIAAGYWPEEWKSTDFLFPFFCRERSLLPGPIQEVDPQQYDSLGELLKDLRKKRGLTQEEVASKLPISQKYLSDLELGYRTNPSFRILDSLAEFYHIDLKVFRKLRK